MYVMIKMAFLWNDPARIINVTRGITSSIGRLSLLLSLLLSTPTILESTPAQAQEVLSQLHISLDEQGEGLDVKLVMPAGIHINREAPATLSGAGNPVGLLADAPAFRLKRKPNPQTRLVAKVFFCDDAKTWCKPAQLAFVYQPGVLQPTVQREGAVATSAATPSAGESSAHAASGLKALHYPGAIQDDPVAAFSQAQRENKLVLIDFYGVWCPPCQLLSSQGFTDARVKTLLDKMVVLQLDADKDASWSLKSRYGITGYPTTLVANSNGDELGRYLGFEDADAFSSWLSRTVQSGKPLKYWASKRNSGDRSPETLIGLARALVAINLEEEAVPLFREALPKLQGDDLLQAQLVVLGDAASHGDAKETLALAQALSSRTPMVAGILYGLYGAVDALQDQKDKAEAVKAASEVAALARKAAQNMIGGTPSKELHAQAYEVLGMLAKTQGDAAGAKAAFNQGADALLAVEKTLKGQGSARFDGFRGQAHSLLYLLDQAGRDAEAESYFQALAAAYPEEFTWSFTYAAFLESRNKLPQAKLAAEKALKLSYGDNKLRVVGRLARIQKALGEKDQARTLLKNTIESTPLPADPTVRTHRYVQQLQQALKELESV